MENWKNRGKIIPMLNPRKEGRKDKLSLLSAITKLLEKNIFPTLNKHLPAAEHQHGFREQSTKPYPLSDPE